MNHRSFHGVHVTSVKNLAVDDVSLVNSLQASAILIFELCVVIVLCVVISYVTIKHVLLRRQREIKNLLECRGHSFTLCCSHRII